MTLDLSFQKWMFVFLECGAGARTGSGSCDGLVKVQLTS